MESNKLAKEYSDYCFVKSELESYLGFSLDEGEHALPDYLLPYKTRVGIQLTEAANIMSGCRPRDRVSKMPEADIVNGYEASLWDAIDNDVLTGINLVKDYNYNDEVRVDITLNKDEVTEWTKLHDIPWPFKLNKKIDDTDVIPEDDIRQLIQAATLENEILRNELRNSKSKNAIMLGKYREDDPLLLAIQLRNSEWANYDEDDRKSIPSQDSLVLQIKEQYKIFGMTDVQAKAIEKVACPIKRK